MSHWDKLKEHWRKESKDPGCHLYNDPEGLKEMLEGIDEDRASITKMSTEMVITYLQEFLDHDNQSVYLDELLERLKYVAPGKKKINA